MLQMRILAVSNKKVRIVIFKTLLSYSQKNNHFHLFYLDRNTFVSSLARTLVASNFIVSMTPIITTYLVYKIGV